MNEKKLTDEEIVKALECCANFSTQKDCDLCPIGVIKCFEQENLMPQLALDLIHRLQAEVEELRKAKVIHETVDYCAEDLKEAQAEIERLSKKAVVLEVETNNQKAEIERLTEEKEDLYFQNKNLQTYIDNHEPIWKRNTEQAVKDTAKEILQDLYYEFDRIGDEGSCGEVRLIAERYGVEVE